MAHPAAWGGRYPRYEAYDWFLFSCGPEKFRRVLLGRTPDLADHDDALGLVVAEEEVQAIDEIGPIDGVAADADAGGLPQAGRRGLGHRLVGQGPRPGNDADLALGMDMPRHDADLAFFRRDDARAIRPDQAGLGPAEDPLNPHHVQDRDALGDADRQRQAGIDGLQDGVRGKGRGHIDDCGGGPGFAHRLVHRVEHWQVQMGGAAFAGGDSAHHLGAVGDGLLGMEGPLGAGETLADDLGLGIHQDGHYWASLTARTILAAASPRSSAEVIARPDSFRIFLPSSTLVPSRRTTSGTCRPISRAAATTPSAMTSQRMMPPKMLTRMPSTLASERMILKAAVTRSLVAPPPTSRKFAGAPPWSLMMSMVAIARPAPLTMQPILPSSLM